ncbi:MAG: hypothetical protein ACJ8AT_21350 [Hyalangium sp.]|uniref:hypothetical protein n=1 Tax=Hyalangium sp. TaxID=2028555 RepID=UPI00389AD9AC
MNRSPRDLFLCAVVLVSAACTSQPQVSPPSVVNPRFDPGNAPPVVPLPNDLATDPATGLLHVDPNPDATDADKAFIAYLNTLNGFPANSTATATFTAPIDPASVTPESVRVLDLTDGNAPVAGVTRSYTDQPGDPANPGLISLTAPGNLWLPGHIYAVALLGGEHGLKGAHGEPVVGTPTWAILRSERSLVTCEDLSSPDCKSVTDILPSTEQDPAARIEDQARTAIRLEGIRRQYKPTVDYLIGQGIPREEIALLWSFKITDQPMVVFEPAASPPKVPLPTDLAIDPTTGLINAPVDPASSPAEQQFTTEYLNTLSGFPSATTAGVDILGGDLDLATLTSANVRVRELSPSKDGDSPTTVAATLSFDPVKKRLVVTPPKGLWPKGKTFEVAVIGGSEGLKMKDGRAPIGSAVWALIRGTVPLTTCDDLASADCKSAITLTPIAPADAVRLEGIRRQFKPLLDQLESEGFPRESVSLVWTFSIAPNPEAFFDPANQVVPLPNDIIRVPGEGGQPAHLELPVPDSGTPAAIDLITKLNTLDGFSTTAPVVSETSDPRGVLDEGELDAGTLDAGVGFFKVSPGGDEPQVRICMGCASSPLGDGGTPSSPQQLQIVPQVPLDEQATYAAYLSTDLQDTEGRHLIADPAFALLRSTTPLVDATGKTLVSLISDDQARQLEPVRLTMKPVLDAIAERGIPRGKMALAWGFTTQSIRSGVEQLYALPASLGSALPDTVVDLSNKNTVYKSSFNPYPYNSIGNVYVGHLSIPNVLTGPGGTADPAHPRIEQISFYLTTPSTAAPASGYPVVIWGHPITASNVSLLAMANSLAAAGKALIAIDLPWHGERSTCAGSKGSTALPAATSDNDACASGATCNENTGKCTATSAGSVCIPGGTGDLLCQGQNQGFCLSSGRCEGPAFLLDSTTHAPVVSGWNFISANLFATRDAFRQHAADLAQLERVIQASGTNSLNTRLGTEKLDPNQIHYLGMSLGGMVGAISTSVSPNIHRVVLNAAGADLPSLLLNGLTPEARAFFLQQAAANGLAPGTPAFDQFITAMQWALDPGDPANHAPFLLQRPGVPVDRKVMVQYVEGDPVIPNANTLRIISAANRSASGPRVGVVVNTATSDQTGKDRHIYLINQTYPTLMNQAQQQVVNFLNTGVVP